MQRALVIGLHQLKPGSTHNGTIYVVVACSRGAGCEGLTNTVRDDILFPPLLVPPLHQNVWFHQVLKMFSH